MRTVSRRGFFKTSGLALGALPLVRSIDSLAQVANPIFRHGVASGDPLADRVILWTRVTPRGSSDPQKVSWQLSRDQKFTNTVARGDVETGAARDFTVKLDARGLDTVFLLSPTTTDARLAEVARLGRGYLYYVSLRGVTGASHIDLSSVAGRVKHVRSYANLPVGVTSAPIS